MKFEKRGVKDAETFNAGMEKKLDKKFQDGKKEKKKENEELTFEQIVSQLKFQHKAQPVKTEDMLTEKEKALARK